MMCVAVASYKKQQACVQSMRADPTHTPHTPRMHVRHHAPCRNTLLATLMLCPVPIPQSCYSGLSKIFTDPADQAGLRDRLLRDLTTTMASVRGVEVDAINTTSPWWASIKGAAPKPPASILSDPAFNKWQASLIGVLSRYVVLVDTKTPAVPCRGAPPAWTAPAVSAAQLPLPKCEGRSDTDLLQLMGRHGQPFDAITTIVNVVMSYGMCTVPDRDGFNSYGDFMMAR